MNAAAVKPLPREVVTDAMVARGLAVFESFETPHYPPDLLVREVIEAALHDPNRCGNCGSPLSHVRAHATWCSAACKTAGYRARKASQSRNPARSRRPGGRQASFGPAVRIVAGFLTDFHAYPEARAEQVARGLLTLALPKRQRKPRPRAKERKP